MKDVAEYYPVVCFGEALWDVLPHKIVMGGAPMNVAYHLKKVGESPAIISKVGLDGTGKALIEMLEKEGICTDYFQMDFEKDTGKVFVKIKESNQVLFDIVYPVAWDFIDWKPELEDLVKRADYFVFGSLITRNKPSRDTLFKLLECANVKVLDINLRPPFYNRTVLEELLSRATILKMSLLELELLTGWFGKYLTIEDRINRLKEHFRIETVIVTLPKNGAVLSTGDGFYAHKGYAADLVDTIGSGDALLAAIISKLMDRASPVEVLDYGCRLSALISSYTGACPDYRVGEIMNLTELHV